jgi:hypothetical protein
MPTAQAGSYRVSQVSARNRSGQLAQDVVGWLRSTSPMMPDHKLTLDETDALAAFIMSLRTRK